MKKKLKPLYKELYNLSRKHTNLYILNIDDLFSFHGLKIVLTKEIIHYLDADCQL